MQNYTTHQPLQVTWSGHIPLTCVSLCLLSVTILVLVVQGQVSVVVCDGSCLVFYPGNSLRLCLHYHFLMEHSYRLILFLKKKGILSSKCVNTLVWIIRSFQAWTGKSSFWWGCDWGWDDVLVKTPSQSWSPAFETEGESIWCDFYFKQMQIYF